MNPIADFRRRPLIEELEPRLLFSADFAPTMLDNVIPVSEQRVLGADGEFANTANYQDQAQHSRLEVVFIDLRVDNYQQILADIQKQNGGGRAIEVVLIDSQHDGIAQIGQFLDQHRNIDAIHIISHGSDGSIQLGSTSLDMSTLQQYAAQIHDWGNALKPGADILLYGCDVAADQTGKAFVDRLAQLTGADVAASTDLTGSASLGGNWQFEYRDGKIETAVALDAAGQASWKGTLAAPTLDLDGNNSSGATGADYTTRYPVSGGPIAITDIDAKLADSGSPTLNSLTVSITNLLNGANETLAAITAGTSINASYASGTGVLTLAGTDTVGHYQQVLRSITYQNTAATPNRTARTITFQASDGSATSNLGTATVNWDYVRDDFSPSAYNGNDGTANWNGNWTEFNDDGSAASGRVTVSGGVLNRNLGGLFGDSTLRGVVRGVDLSGASNARLVFDYQLSSLALLGNATIQVDVSSDGGANWHTVFTSGGSTSWTTASIDISAYASANTQIRLLSSSSAVLSLAGSAQFDNVEVRSDPYGAPPSVDLDANNSSGATGANFVSNFTEGGAAAPVADVDAVLSDTRSAVLTEMVATLINPLDGAAESLSANVSGTSITASYDTSTGTLTLSGTDTLANYQQVLRTISYTNSSDNPDTNSRLITVAASDGTGQSNVATATISVTAVNDPPANTVPGAQSTNEDTPLVFSTANGNALSIADVDAGASPVQVTLTATHGVLTLAGTTGLSFVGGDGTADASMSFSGTLTDINAALDGLGFAPDLNYNGAASVQITTNDLGNTGSGGPLSATNSVAVTVNAVNDAPTNAVPGAQSTNEDTPLVFSAANGNALSIADVDAGASPVQVTLTATHGVLTLAGTTGLSFVSGDGTADASMSFSGTLTDINAALDGLGFAPDLNYNGAASVQITTNDLGNTGSGGPLSATNSVAVTVNAVNDAPTNSVPGAQSTNEDTPLVFSTANGNALSIADVDAGASPVQVTLTATHGVLTLAGTTGLSFVSGDGTADASMSFSGTLTDINAALDGLGFAPDLNYNGAASVQITTNDLGNTGSGGPLSATNSVAVTVNAVNDAPTNAVPGAQSTNEDTPLVFSAANGNALSIADVDAGASPVQVTLTATHGVLTLAGTTGLSFVGGDGTADASMSFSGTLTDINAALDGLGFAPDLNYNGAASVQITTNDLGNTGSGGPLSATNSVAVTVIPVNDPPVITSNGGGPNAAVSMPENSTAVTTVTASDVDLPPDTLTYAIVGGADQARFSINTATGALRFVSAPNFEAPTDSNGDNVYNVTVQVSDGNGGTDTQAIAVSVTDVNEPPVITSNGAGPTATVGMPENTTAVTVVTATDPDLPAQTLTYSITGGADQAKFNIDSATGALSFVTAPDFEAPTDSNADNVYDVTVQVSDGNGGTDTQGISVSVTDVNEPPVITSNGGAASVQGNVLENTTAVTTVTATDPDLPAQTLSYSIVGGADQARFAINTSSGVLSFVSAPNFEVPTDSNADNVYNVTVQVSDGNGGTDTQAFSITVTNVNEPPAITSNGGNSSASVSVPENTTAVTTVTATDPDLPKQTLSYSIVGGADQARFTINSATGALSFLAAPNFEAPADSNGDNVYDVTVQASDGNGGTDTQAIAVSVTDVNEPPVITSNGGNPNASVSVPENTTAVTTVTATDPDLPAQTLTYSINGGVDQAKFNIDSATGALSFSIAPNFEAPTDSNADNVYSVTVQVSDGKGGTATQTLAVAVTNVNEPPVATNDSAAGIEGNAIGGNVLANDSDPEGSTITAILVTRPAHGTLTFNANGSFSYSPNAHFNGTDSFTYRASDGTFSSNLATVTLSVSPVGTVPPDTPPPPKPPGGPVIPVVEPPHPVTTTPTPSGPLGPGAPPSADPAESHVVQVTLSGGHDSASPQFIDLIGKQHEAFGGPDQLNVGLLKLLDTARVEGDPGRADHNLISPPVAVELAPGDNFKVNIYAESAKFSAVFLSVGAVWWGLQAGGLMAGLLASLPAWRSFDVLPVLRDEEEDDELYWESDDEDNRREQRPEPSAAQSDEVPG